MIHYSCIGATGYVCGEVLRMMVNHHEGELVNVLDTYGVGDAISTHHPALRGFYDQVIMDLTEENVRETAKKSVFILFMMIFSVLILSPIGAADKKTDMVKVIFSTKSGKTGYYRDLFLYGILCGIFSATLFFFPYII